MARQVADAIGASFNVLISRTIGVPGIEGSAFAAISKSERRCRSGSARVVHRRPAGDRRPTGESRANRGPG